MIKSFKDKNTEKLYSGSFVKEFSGFERQAIRRLQILDSAACLNDLRELPSNRFESLKGQRSGEYSIRINKQWLICFNRVLKISQLLRRYKKFKLLRMSKYAATLNFFCSLHLKFLNTLLDKDFFNKLLNGTKIIPRKQ